MSQNPETNKMRTGPDVVKVIFVVFPIAPFRKQSQVVQFCVPDSELLNSFP